MLKCDDSSVMPFHKLRRMGGAVNLMLCNTHKNTKIYHNKSRVFLFNDFFPVLLIEN